MILKAFNRLLVRDQEKTYLTAAPAVAATALTVAAVDSNAWADDDFIIVGEIGTRNAEIVRISAAVSDGTALTISQSAVDPDSGGLRYAHAIGEPVYRVFYNRVEFSRNTTDTSAGVTVLATNEIQPDDEFTRYIDTTNTTGYGFVRFNNQRASTFSSYSDGVNYEATGVRSSRDPRTLWMLRKRVRRLLDEPDEAKVTDEMIDDALNDKQRDIGHERLWTFYEVERSFATSANQSTYDLPSTVKSVYAVRFRTQPLVYVNKAKWDILHWNQSATTRTPTHYTIWNNQILLYPRPDTAAVTTAINDAAGISATATSVTVDATASFLRGEKFRFIIDSEVMVAGGSTATTFTVLTRAMEGTTAATHADNATITERDIVYTAQAEPTDMVDTQDRTDVPEPETLAAGAAADLALLIGKETVHDRLFLRYEKGIKKLENRYAIKQIAQFGRVKSVDELVSDSTRIINPNQTPQDISGT